jgi:hypothetical protein
MTHNATEVFTMQLARAAGKTANRFLRGRGLQRSDRDDVIAAAMLWCWENRENYSLTTTLETWFMNAVRDAYKKLRSAEVPTSDESLDGIGGGEEDPTYSAAAADSAARALIGALTPGDKSIAVLIMQGFTRRELVEGGRSRREVDEAYQRIRQLRRLVPDEARSRRLLQTAPADDADDADDKPSEIDMQIEQLDFAPPAGKDCPPCWRCQWYYGFLPSGKRDTRMEIEDPEVREAVKVTEARKIEIAQRVRDGL